MAARGRRIDESLATAAADMVLPSPPAALDARAAFPAYLPVRRQQMGAPTKSKILWGKEAQWSECIFAARRKQAMRNLCRRSEAESAGPEAGSRLVTAKADAKPG